MNALVQAVQAMDLEQVASILEHRAIDPDVLEDGMTPLLWASQLNLPAVIWVLLKSGANPNLGDDDGETPLHVAAFEGNEACARALLDHGAQVNAQTSEGKTPLMNAAQSGSVPMVDLLIEAGANIEGTDHSGRTVLHWAAVGSHDDTAVVERFLAAGPVRDRPNLGGQTALDYARDLRRTAISKVLSSIRT